MSGAQLHRWCIINRWRLPNNVSDPCGWSVSTVSNQHRDTHIQVIKELEVAGSIGCFFDSPGKISCSGSTLGPVTADYSIKGATLDGLTLYCLKLALFVCAKDNKILAYKQVKYMYILSHAKGVGSPSNHATKGHNFPKLYYLMNTWLNILRQSPDVLRHGSL